MLNWKHMNNVLSQFNDNLILFIYSSIHLVGLIKRMKENDVCQDFKTAVILNIFVEVYIWTVYFKRFQLHILDKHKNLIIFGPIGFDFLPFWGQTRVVIPSANKEHWLIEWLKCEPHGSSLFHRGGEWSFKNDGSRKIFVDFHGSRSLVF